VTEAPVVREYEGRSASLATKHQKDVACGRPLRRALGVDLVVPDALDTDELGTFSGEIPRVGTPATEMILLEAWGCAACSYGEERPRRDGLRLAPPRHCPQCNA
jgi:hypothetical protein